MKPAHANELLNLINQNDDTSFMRVIGGPNFYETRISEHTVRGPLTHFIDPEGQVATIDEDGNDASLRVNSEAGTTLTIEIQSFRGVNIALGCIAQLGFNGDSDSLPQLDYQGHAVLEDENGPMTQVVFADRNPLV